MEDELFECRNGQVIIDPSVSEKMFLIKREHPERGDGSDDATAYEWSEMGMAELFGVLYEKDCRYCPERKCWYTYYDGAWRRDEGEMLVSSKIKEFARLMLLYCGEIEDDSMRGAYLKFVDKMGDRRMRDRIMKDARDVLPISASEFDSDPYLINCLNGTYNLHNCTFHEHNWHDFLTMQTNFSHTVRRDVKCERWEQFIDEVCEGNKDKADYLQRALGYSMLGLSNEECMFILWGKTTRNGKSTLLNTIQHLLGDYARVAPVGLICKDRIGSTSNTEGASPVLASLKGRRFVTMAESNEYGKLDEEKIKQMTGGEEITARNLYESAMTFLPQFTLWLSCNDLPAVTDRSLFASDRIRVVEFGRHFSASEQDKHLKEEFMTQDAMSGIFMWMVRGFKLYRSRGLEMSPAMKKVVAQYEKDNDVVEMFLEATCMKVSDGSPTSANEYSITFKALYERYKIWCKAEGYRWLPVQKFCGEMERHSEWHDGRATLHGVNVWRGLRLKSISDVVSGTK